MLWPDVDLDWECWALPLSVAYSGDWKQAIVRIGPICISWGWSGFEKKMEDFSRALDQMNEVLGEDHDAL